MQKRKACRSPYWLCTDPEPWCVDHHLCSTQYEPVWVSDRGVVVGRGDRFPPFSALSHISRIPFCWVKWVPVLSVWVEDAELRRGPRPSA